jgi:transposase
MSPLQFGTIAKLLRSSGGAPEETAFLVLVMGKSRKDAMLATQLSGPAATQAVRRYREADEMIGAAYYAGAGSGISEQQFEVVAKLLRSREPAKTAARQVLVNWDRRKEAMRLTNLSGPAASQVVRRYREVDELLRKAYMPA